MAENKKKIRDIRSEVIAFDGDTITLKLHDEVDMDKAQELAVNGRLFTYLEFYDKDTISDMQRDHYYALVGDIHEYTGLPEDSIDSRLKFEFMSYFLLDEFPSVSRGSMRKNVASQLIEFTITYCIQNDIPFRKQQFYLTTDTSKMVYGLTMNRLCVVCGEEHAQAHHVEAVGMGRDRTKVDHTKHSFLMLCTNHHDEIHKTGYRAFCEKYYVKAVKLNKEDLQQLNIQGNYEER